MGELFSVSALATHSPKCFTQVKESVKVRDVISVVIGFFFFPLDL